jgi:hypothetical protein
VILTAAVEGNWMDYRGIERHDDRYSGQLSATWLLNRSVGIALQVSHASQHSYGVARGRSFDDTSVGLALTLQR